MAERLNGERPSVPDRDQWGVVSWRLPDGRLHREDGAAYERPGLLREWWLNGKRHRLDGPAVELSEGTRAWYRDDRLHRDDGPAIEWSCGTKQWYREGVPHRDDGPANEHADGAKEWYVNGRRHRDDGPAIENPDGYKRWYWRGAEVPEKAITAPETLTPDEIFSEINVEVRRALIERFGVERLFRETKAERAHSDRYGTLWMIPLDYDEPLVAVEVTDPSTGRTYLLRVDPTAYGGLETARAAVASTWRYPDGSLVFKRPEDYVLAAEA